VYLEALLGVGLVAFCAMIWLDSLDLDSLFFPSFFCFLIRMDHDSSIRVTIRIVPYEQLVDSGRVLLHDSRKFTWVVDKDTISWMDLYADLEGEIKHSVMQKLILTFWDKICHEYKEIDSDSTLLAAFDMYWQIRRLPLTIAVINQPINELDSGMECSSHVGSRSTMNAKLPNVVVESQLLDNFCMQ
jgi:hypothetical protein